MATTYPHASSTFDDDEDELCPFDEVPSSKMIIEKFDQLMYEAERAPKALARNAKSFPPSAGSIMTRSTTGMSSKASINTAPHHDQDHHHHGLMDDGEEEMKIVAISALPSIESNGDTSSKRGKGSKKAKKDRVNEEDQEEKQKDSGEEILKTMYQFGSGMIKSAQSILSPAPGVFRHHHEQQKESTSAKHVSKLKEKIACTKRLSPEEAENIQDMMEAQQLQEEISRRRRDHHKQEEEADKRSRHHIAKLKHKIACSKRLSSEDDEREADIAMEEEQQHQHLKSNTNRINIMKHKIACSKRSLPEEDNIPVIMEAQQHQHQQEQEQQPETKSSLRQVMSFGSWSFPSNKRGGSRDDDDDFDTNNDHEEEDGIGTEMVHDDVEEQLRMLDSIVESAVSTSSSSSSTKERSNLSRDTADNVNEEQFVDVEDGVLTRDELFGNIRMFTVSTNTKNGGGDSKGGSTTNDDKKSSSHSASTSVLTPQQKQERLRRRRIETFIIYVFLFLSAFVMLYLGLKHRSRKGADEEN